MGIKELSTEKREKMIASLWEERRGRMPSQTLQPTSLFITVPSKDVSMDKVFDGLLDTMVSSDAEMLYKWASNWGQTRITVHSQKGLSFQFMDRLSNEAKSYDFLTTKNLVEPGEYFRQNLERSNTKYHILLNDSPIKIEGAILQAERMLDELVWCVMMKNAPNGTTDASVYKTALMEVRGGGFDFKYVPDVDILDLKQKNPDFALRIYGDSLNKGTVPQIVGAICPFNRETILPSLNLNEVPKQRIKTAEVRKTRLVEVVDNQLPFVALGITLAKQPHLGHMLLAGVVNATSRTLDNAPICIDGNDTGPRINAAVKYGAKMMGISTSQIVEDLMAGRIGTSILEEWYRNRKNIDDRTIIKDSSNEKGLSLIKQSESTLQVFRKFFLAGVDVCMILESQNLDVANDFTEVGDESWEGTGFGCVNLGSRLLILEREGNPSSEVVRASFIGTASKALNCGKAYFVDSDLSLKDVFHIYKLATGHESTQINGAAIGFDFEIASGTSGNSMPMEDFLNWYQENYPNSSAVDDITYLVHSRFQISSANELPFFNYKNVESFLSDVHRSHTERTQFRSELELAFAQLSHRTSVEAERTLFKGEKKERKRSAYVLNLLKEFSRNLESGDVHVYMPPENLKETPEVCKAIDLLANDKKISKDDARAVVLLSIAHGESNLRSTYIEQLRTSGFDSEEELCKAVETVCNGNLGMERPVNVLFAAANFIIEIKDKVDVLDKESSELLSKLYIKISSSI